MMKSKFVYLAATVLFAGTALAQSSIQTPILDSYTAALLECECSHDHPDGHGVPEFVRKSDEMRAKAWATETPAPEAAKSDSGMARPQAMAANVAGSAKNKGSRAPVNRAGAH